MKAIKKDGNKVFFIITLGIFLLDFVTKQTVRHFAISTQTGLVDITYATNTGTMWSLFSGANAINLVFIVLSFVAIGALCWYKHQEPKHYLPIAVILAGILGNLIDRIVYGSVIDWINFHVWPIFNIADSAIVIGVIVLIWQTIKHK